MSASQFTWGRNAPAKGQAVSFRVYVPSCVPGEPPFACYAGRGVYLGECLDGFMTRATECSAPQNVGEVIFTRSLVADTGNAGGLDL